MITPPRNAHQDAVCNNGGNATHIGTVPYPPSGGSVENKKGNEGIPKETEAFSGFVCHYQQWNKGNKYEKTELRHRPCPIQQCPSEYAKEEQQKLFHASNV